MLANYFLWCSTRKASSEIMNIFITLMLLAVVTANAVTPEIPTISDNENQFPDMLTSDQHDGFDTEKRSNWQKLQGGWGKRGDMELVNENDDPLLTDHIIPVVLANGDSINNKVELAFLINAATLEHLASNRQQSLDMDADADIINEKRAWKSMAVGWGKRRNAPTWNKFGGRFKLFFRNIFLLLQYFFLITNKFLLHPIQAVGANVNQTGTISRACGVNALQTGVNCRLVGESGRLPNSNCIQLEI